MPSPSIPRQQNLGGLRSQRSGGIERELWPGFGLPMFDDRIDNGPSIVDPIRTSKERLITLHGIMEQPFIGTGRAFDRKGQIIAETHSHRAQTDVWTWLFGQKRVLNAFIGLEAKGQNVARQLSTVINRKHHVGGGLELYGNVGAFLWEPFARA